MLIYIVKGEDEMYAYMYVCMHIRGHVCKRVFQLSDSEGGSMRMLALLSQALF